jgi:CRP/FNR family transcriptional regulator
MFRGLPREQLHELSAIVILQTFKRGESIFFEGEEAHGFYIATSGRIKISKISFEGKEQILHLFGPGEPFGEVPVFAGKNFPASAEALAESHVLYFPRQKFIDLVKNTPQLALNMLAILSQRLHMFAALIEELSLKEVPSRLATYLLYLSEKQGMAKEVTLDISKTQLSSLLGTIPETLSRILARMTAEGIVTSKGTAKVQLEDRDMLEKLASGEVRLSKK